MPNVAKAAAARVDHDPERHVALVLGRPPGERWDTVLLANILHDHPPGRCQAILAAAGRYALAHHVERPVNWTCSVQ